MALQQVNFGSASDGSQGDTARAAFGKINQNFSDTTNAASRLVGTAAGQVMEVGAFGAGSTVLAARTEDLNTYQAAGLRAFTAGSAANSPFAEYGYLQVDGVGDVANRVAQTWTSRTNRKFFRTLQADGWTVWREQVGVDTLASSGLAGNAAAVGGSTLNLNDAVIGGFCRVEGSASAGASLNWPANGATGSTQVAYEVQTDGVSGSGARLRQFATEVFGSGSGQGGRGRTFVRVRHDGTWFGWRELAFSDTPVFTGAVTCGGPVRVGQYTLASLPSASAFTGYEIDVTDASGGAKRCRSDGTNWKIINTTTTVS